MSLEASRHLWNARVDPRRRKHAIGMYTHVLDQWGIIYDQPIVLNQRQAGAAIEGVVRNTVAPDIEMLAVDTHGYTDFGMGVSKILPFDLCPRLKNIKHRHLYVTRGSTVPASIREVCRCEVAPEDIVAQWDPLLRLAASIREGYVSAVHDLSRYGSAARGDAIYLAGTSLGRLVRTVFLCDYFTNETFRRELLRILNHGEAVHTLQRAIHRGGIGVRRGRHEGELIATSGSLSLLANIVMAWVTHRMQGVLDGWSSKGRVLSASEIEALRHTSPLHFDGLNFRGVMSFPIEKHASRLIDRRRLQLA
jgi:TnpA family transposase